jgi:hypothetical protein
MKKIFLSSVLFTFVFSCSKEKLEIKSNESAVTLETKAQEKPNIDELIQKSEQLSQILGEVYKDKNAFTEVNETIYSDYYADERVLLKDLLQPDQSDLFKNSKNLRGKPQVFFKETFEKVFEDKFNKNGRTNAADFEDYLIKNGVSIYFPYSKNFANKNSTKITVVVPQQKESDEGDGIEYSDKGSKNVKVNDEYAQKNPTHIIVAEAKKSSKPENDLSHGRIASVNRVYIGEVTFRQQYDPLIGFYNSGGPDFRLCRISGYLQVVGGLVTSPTGDTKELNCARGDKDYGVDVFWLWDTDWLASNTSQILAIYEQDNTNKDVTFTGSIGTTLKASASSTSTVTGSIGYTMKFKSDDSIIKQTTWNRNSFFSSNGYAAGWGTRTYPSRGFNSNYACYDGYISVATNSPSFAYTMPTQFIP